DPPQRFLIPVRLQLSVQLSKACGQRGIEDDRHLQPITSLASDDRFQFVEQLLGATDAEGRDKYSATVPQGLLQCALKTLSPGAPVFMQSVAVGAFQHLFICAIGNGWRRQYGRMGRAEITGEYDAAPA